jgi:hypothetical protein
MLIDKIVLINLNKMLLGFYIVFKKTDNKLCSLLLLINNDGESVNCYQYDRLVSDKNIINVFSISGVLDFIEVKQSHHLYSLIGLQIDSIEYGVDNIDNSLYYIRINLLSDIKFLFFNNGDKADYLLNNFDNFLANSIYEYDWKDKMPSILL